MWGDEPEFRDGPDVITRSLPVDDRGRSDAMCERCCWWFLALKAEEGAGSRGMQAASKSRKKMHSLVSSPGRNATLTTTSFLAQGDPFQTLTSSTVREQIRIALSHLICGNLLQEQQKTKTLSWRIWAAIMEYHRRGGLSTADIHVHISGGWESKMKTPEESVWRAPGFWLTADRLLPVVLTGQEWWRSAVGSLWQGHWAHCGNSTFMTSSPPKGPTSHDDHNGA